MFTFYLPVTELVSRLLPVGPDGEVVHREGGVSGHVPLHLDEGGQGVQDLVLLQGSEGLQQDQPLAPGVAGGPVDIQLILLVLYSRYIQYSV